MQTQHNDFVQINNQRFSIEQFLDILEAQQKYLKKTEAVITNDDDEDEDNFGLIESEVDQVKEDCIQAVLNNLDFEAVVNVLNHFCKEHTDYDTELDTAYDFLYRCYDEWKADFDDQVFVKRHGYYECNIYPDGVVCLKFVPMQIIGNVKASPWN